MDLSLAGVRRDGEQLLPRLAAAAAVDGRSPGAAVERPTKNGKTPQGMFWSGEICDAMKTRGVRANRPPQHEVAASGEAHAGASGRGCVYDALAKSLSEPRKQFIIVEVPAAGRPESVEGTTVQAAGRAEFLELEARLLATLDGMAAKIGAMEAALAAKGEASLMHRATLGSALASERVGGVGDDRGGQPKSRPRPAVRALPVPPRSEDPAATWEMRECLVVAVLASLVQRFGEEVYRAAALVMLLLRGGVEASSDAVAALWKARRTSRGAWQRASWRPISR